MNTHDKAVKAALVAQNRFPGGVWFGMAGDNACYPNLILDVLQDTQIAVLGPGASTSVITYQLRAVSDPDHDDAGDLAEAAAAGLVTTPPVGATSVTVPDTGTSRRRYMDADGFYNAVVTATIYF